MLEVIKAANLGLRFLLELCMLAALGYWGFRTGTDPILKIVLGIGTPLLAAVLWGVFGAPKAMLKLSMPWHTLFDVGLFLIAVAALAVADQPKLAGAFAAIYVVNEILLFAWGQA